MTHQQLLKHTILELQKRYPSSRWFERHVGVFFTKKGTPIRINRPGMADAWGIIPVNNIALHIELEFKVKSDRQRPEQKNWEKIINGLNCFYFIVKDNCDDVLVEIERIIKEAAEATPV